MLGSDDSAFLQQAAHLSGGIYIRLGNPPALLQTLLVISAIPAWDIALEVVYSKVVILVWVQQHSAPPAQLATLAHAVCQPASYNMCRTCSWQFAECKNFVYVYWSLHLPLADTSG